MKLFEKFGEICVATLNKIVNNVVNCDDMSITIGEKPEADISILDKDNFEMFAKVIKYIVECNVTRRHTSVLSFISKFIPFLNISEDDIKLNLCKSFVGIVNEFGHNSVSKVWHNENNINVVSISESTIEIHYYLIHGYPTIDIVVSNELVFSGRLNPKFELIQLYDYYNNVSLI